MKNRIEIIDGSREEFAVWLWDEETTTEAVVFYDLEISSSSPLEVRMWSSQWPTSREGREKIQKQFSNYPKQSFSDANRRAVRIGELHREALKHVGKQSGSRIKRFNPPNEDDLTILLATKDNVMFRNKRDLEAHVQELRAVEAYLIAVVFLASDSPMSSVSDAVGLDLIKSRAIIERARAHGYLTRNDGGVGGELTEYAEVTAKTIRLAADNHRKAMG